MIKKLIFASDYRGIELRKSLYEYAKSLGMDIKDIGIDEESTLDYVDISKLLITEMKDKSILGVLICGSGQGVSIVANRSNKIRAVLCRDSQDAINARSRLNANVLCLGSKNTSFDEAIKCLNAFIDTDFVSEKHKKCIFKLDASVTEHTYSGVNLIVRGVIIHEGHVLLTTATNNNTEFASDLYFLPGGHVDYKESASEALVREIKEEMDQDVSHLDFCGVLECTWDRMGRIYHELNLVYRVYISGLSLENPPAAIDPFHQFVWRPISAISDNKILPETLIPIIKEAEANLGPTSLLLSQMI